MANENYIEELKVQIYDSINSQRNSARKKLDSDLEALKVEYEKKKFEFEKHVFLNAPLCKGAQEMLEHCSKMSKSVRSRQPVTAGAY